MKRYTDIGGIKMSNLIHRLKILGEISSLMAWGVPQKIIAQKLNISQQMVSYYRKEIYNQYIEDNASTIDDRSDNS